jgi:hypothetical protein
MLAAAEIRLQRQSGPSSAAAPIGPFELVWFDPPLQDA